MSWDYSTEYDSPLVLLERPMNWCDRCQRYISNRDRHDGSPCSRRHPNPTRGES